MERADKINLLQGIANGDLSIAALIPAKVYVFTELLEPRRYIDNDKIEYSIKEYEDFCNKIQSLNIQMDKVNPRGKKNVVITVSFVKGKSIL